MKRRVMNHGYKEVSSKKESSYQGGKKSPCKKTWQKSCSQEGD
jgi:hypothetical protein